MIERFFPTRQFKALLFDFDGTVADTMPTHLAAWNRALKIYNLTLSKEQHLEWAGRPTVQIVQLLNEKHGTQIQPEIFLKQKEVEYFANIKTVRAINSVVDIIHFYRGRLPMAIVSGSRRKPVETTLAQLGLSSEFDVLVCAEDYVRGKPDPDCFLQAASLLKVAPADCLVFEDGHLGIEAAHRAGMACIKVTESFDLETTQPPLSFAPATLKIRFNTKFAEAADPELKWRILRDGTETLARNVKINVPSKTTHDLLPGGLEKWHFTCEGVLIHEGADSYRIEPAR